MEAVRHRTELLDAAGQATIAVDLAGVVLLWSRAAERIYGWSEAEATGRQLSELICSDDLEQEDLIRRETAAGRSWAGDCWVVRRDGSRFQVYVATTPVFDRESRLVALIGVVSDSTDRRAGDDARRLLAAIVAGSGDAILTVSTAGIVTSWNQAAGALVGYEEAEIVGCPVSVLSPPDRVGEQLATWARLTAGGPPEQVETVCVRKDGTPIDVLMTVSRVPDEAGNTVALSVIAHDISGRRSAQHALETSEKRLAVAQRIAHVGSFELDLVTGDMTWSDEYSRILGFDPEVTPSGDLFLSLVLAEDRVGLEEAWGRAIRVGASFDLVFRIVRTDGSQRSVHLLCVPETDEQATVVRMVGTLTDETDRVEAARVQQQAETQFEIGFEQASIGAVIADLDGVPTRVNPALCRLLARPQELLVGRRWTEFAHSEEVPLGEAVIAHVAAGHDTYSDERRYLRPDGTTVWASVDVSLVRDEMAQPQYFFTQLQDITERKQMEGDLAHQALHDSLTGLPNRVLLIDRLVHGLAASRRRGSQVGVIFVDLDGLKEVNDSQGHDAGDRLIKATADQIAGAIRPGDTAARLGGDEFVIVCEDVSALEARAVAARVLAAVSDQRAVGDQDRTVSASIGIAIADRSATPETLLRDADAAMYWAKTRGRGRVELFDEALRSNARKRSAMTVALNGALERGELAVYYQPIVDLETGDLVSAEALLRWANPDLGNVSPDEFIPIAESTGLIIPIGTWVLERACEQLAAWHHVDPSMAVAVNLSVRQLIRPEITTIVEEVLSRYGIRPDRVCLELTESVMMEEVEYFEHALTNLKELGIRLAIDDFGTGYSSLSHLKRFPFDAVKVDRSFTSGLGTDKHDSALVAAVVAMAGAFDLDVVAEGVETREQMTALKDLRCAQAQGYYLGRPMTAEAITRFVTAAHCWQVD